MTDRESDASWFRRRLRQQRLCCRAGRHRDELRSLLAQSSWLVMSPFPITPQVLLFFLRWVMTSHSEPESASEPESEELEEEEEDESLELSEAMPVDSCRSTLSARAAISGLSCFRIRYHFLESLGRPRTVLCHTMGKLVVLEKFWVTAIAVSRLSTTCHHPPTQNTGFNLNHGCF